jgi:GTP-binding protein EngB required for normal cell division
LNDIPGFNKGYNQIHPRCKHRLTAYYEDYVDNAEETKRLSNLPFEDRRTPQQKSKYDKGQELQRYRLAKRNNLDKRKALSESKEDKDKRKIKRLEETSRRYTQQIKEIRSEL